MVATTITTKIKKVFRLYIYLNIVSPWLNIALPISPGLKTMQYLFKIFVQSLKNVKLTPPPKKNQNK